MTTVKNMYELMIKIQTNFDDLLADVKKLEQDELVRTWMITQFPSKRPLSQTVESTAQLMEGLVRMFKEAAKIK